MKFAVTGGAGFIGSRIVRSLLKQGDSVRVIDNLHTGRMENLEGVIDEIDFAKTDIRNLDEMRKNIVDVDGIFHEAALTVVQESFTKQDEYYDVNVTGTENIFKIAQENSIRVVFASSSSVYGDTTEIPIKEDHPRNPANPYGVTKMKGETLAEKYAMVNLNAVGLRYFNVFGSGQTGSYAGVITKFINRLKEQKPLLINGDGEQIRDFVFVDDVADANIAAMKSNANGLYNIGTGLGTTINHLADILIEISGEKISKIYTDSLDGDVRCSQADTLQAEKNLNWRFQTPLDEGLEKICGTASAISGFKKKEKSLN